MAPQVENRPKSERKLPRSAFKPGQSGNPHGRPRKDPAVEEILRAAAPQAARALVEIANDPNHRDRVKACMVLLDRVFGKATEHHEVSGDVTFVLRDPFATPGDTGHA